MANTMWKPEQCPADVWVLGSCVCFFIDVVLFCWIDDDDNGNFVIFIIVDYVCVNDFMKSVTPIKNCFDMAFMGIKCYDETVSHENKFSFTNHCIQG